MSDPTLHQLLDVAATDLSTMAALTALGDLKVWVREREVDLVTMAREETHTWVDIAHALQRDLSTMDLLYRRSTGG